MNKPKVIAEDGPELNPSRKYKYNGIAVPDFGPETPLDRAARNNFYEPDYWTEPNENGQYPVSASLVNETTN